MFSWWKTAWSGIHSPNRQGVVRVPSKWRNSAWSGKRMLPCAQNISCHNTEEMSSDKFSVKMQQKEAEAQGCVWTTGLDNCSPKSPLEQSWKKTLVDLQCLLELTMHKGMTILPKWMSSQLLFHYWIVLAVQRPAQAPPQLSTLPGTYNYLNVLCASWYFGLTQTERCNNSAIGEVQTGP